MLSFPLLGRRIPHPPERHGTKIAVQPIRTKLSAPCAQKKSRFFPTTTDGDDDVRRKKNFGHLFLRSPEPPLHLRIQSHHNNGRAHKANLDAAASSSSTYFLAFLWTTAVLELTEKDVSPELFPSGSMALQAQPQMTQITVENGN